MGADTRKTIGTAFALFGIFISFPVFAIASLVVGSELVAGTAEPDKLGGFTICLGLTVTTVWILAAAIVKRSRFRWATDGFRACSAFAWAGVVGCIMFAVTLLVEHWGDLGTEVYFVASSSGHRGWWWPAWASALAWLSLSGLLAGVGWLFLRYASTPLTTTGRHPKR